MPSKIRILDEVTINQIAAGEVIENPASVVKELVENALDAGASHITIEIKAGGFQLIRITDDGEGMSGDDALLAFERHGTSKIARFDDLLDLNSMGFRGEALASILSVSQIALLTGDGSEATEVEAAGGRIIKARKGSRSRGTTLEVRSLFYNVPARREFQKSPGRSTADITKMVTKLALAHPQIALTFISNESEIFKVKPSTLRARAQELLGEEFVGGGQELHFEHELFVLRGLLGAPQQSRTNRSGQFLFLNRRPVQCFPISWGVEEGYATRLNPRSYPQFLLHIEMPSASLDVNVHPQKQQVRLKDEEGIKEAIRALVASSWEVPFESFETPVVDSLPFSLKEECHSFSSYPQFDFSLKEERISAPVQETFFQKPAYEILGLFAHFLLLKEGEGLIIFDLKEAAHHLLAARHEKGPLAQQNLLIPLTFEFPLHEALRIQQEIEYLNAIGVGIRPFGERTFIVESLSDLIDASCVEPLLQELLSQSERSRAVKKSLAQRRRAFNLAEAKALYEEVKRLEKIPKCLVQLGEKDLEKLIQTS